MIVVNAFRLLCRRRRRTIGFFDPTTNKTTTIVSTTTSSSSRLSNNHIYCHRYFSNTNPPTITTAITSYYYDHNNHVNVNVNNRRYLHQKHQHQQPAVAFDKKPKKKKKKKKILFQSLGCPRNFVDTEVMVGLSIDSEKLDLIQDIDDNDNTIPDYVVINTCGFLESARQESKNVIEDIIDLKLKQQCDNNSNKTKLIVTGCMVNIQKDLLLKEYPEIDSILGSGDIDQVVKTIEQLEEQEEESKQQQRHVILSSSERKSFLEQGETPRFIGTPGHYAYLKIAEGCKKRCSFCIIPTIKGKLQSKPINQLVDEFTALREYGASEIILIAQDLGDYGKDFNINDTTNTINGLNKNKNNKSHLEILLKELLNSTDDDNENLWLRLLYLYPDEITTGLIDLMENDTRICRYLDMPIQHSHDSILKKMRRKTNLYEIETTIDKLRTKLPNLHIRTSLMVGFPGETNEKFQHLLDFVKRHQLENVGVFKYSNENLALSSRLPDHVSEEIKEERYQQLMEIQYDIVCNKNQLMVDDKTKLEVVVEGLGGIDGQDIVGRYYGQCPDIDGQVILQQQQQHAHEGSRQRRRQNRRSSSRTRRNSQPKDLIPGERYMVEVIGYQDYDLIGKVL